MKAVNLAGGTGTRISEESSSRLKSIVKGALRKYSKELVA
jgi:hypothetical protein